MEKLKVPVVADEDVLEVLRLWHFKSNRSRTNVFPEGANFVHSDTLGAIRNRVGKVVPTAMTIKHPSVYALLARWLEDNTPDVFHSLSRLRLSTSIMVTQQSHTVINMILAHP